MGPKHIMIVEDDVALLDALTDTLAPEGYQITRLGNPDAVMETLDEKPVDLVLSDIQFGALGPERSNGIDGHQLLRDITSRYRDLPVVLMTAYGTIEKAVEAIRDGAADYLVKPFESNTLVEMIRSLLRSADVESKGLVAVDPKTIELSRLARRVAATDVSVLMQGESGTGKEVLAQYIHARSPRANKPIVAINCAAIPENMLEAVLFGHEKGAFTGAHQSNPGKFEQAEGGTLLLDEISEMDMGLQAKLLRVLQERQVERLGGRKVINLDVRVLATTNRDLKQDVAEGRFREDLFYRLNVFPLRIPPLRERKQDVLPLAENLLQRHFNGIGHVPQLSSNARTRLLEHHWPGNVRELENIIQRALILCDGRSIRDEDLHFENAFPPSQIVTDGRLTMDLKCHEQDLILAALESGNGNRRLAAERLGISQRTLRYKLAKMREAGVEVPPAYGMTHA